MLLQLFRTIGIFYEFLSQAVPDNVDNSDVWNVVHFVLLFHVQHILASASDAGRRLFPRGGARSRNVGQAASVRFAHLRQSAAQVRFRRAHQSAQRDQREEELLSLTQVHPHKF